MAKLSQAVYMLVDHYVWAAKIGLTSADPKLLSKTASKFWLTSLVFNLIRDLYAIVTVVDNHRRASRRRRTKTQREASWDEARTVGEDTRTVRPNGGWLRLILANKPLITDTIKNSADLLLPMANLGFVDISLKVQGMLGIISSIMGILMVWNPSLKLKP